LSLPTGGYVTQRFAVSRYVAQREISRKAGGVHCYCWMNLGWCFCAFIMHVVRIIERWGLSFCPSECLSLTSLGVHKLSIGVAVLKSCRKFNFGSYCSLQIPERQYVHCINANTTNNNNNNKEQDGQRTYNVTSWRVRVTIFAVSHCQLYKNNEWCITMLL